MAIYKRLYRPYAGRYTGHRFRFWVITKSALRTLFDSRFLLAFFVACNIPFVIFLLIIYITNNAAAQALLQVKGSPILIDNFFFLRYLIFQSTLSFLITAWVGPGLVSVDLSNDALPLYLARPLTRTEYLLGKFGVIFMLTSAITWVPGLMLLGLESSLGPIGWFQHYYWLFGSMFIGSLLWIAVIGLLSLTLSAWVKWRIVATGAMLGIFFALAGFGEALNQVLRTNWGHVLNLGYDINLAWFNLFRMDSVTGPYNKPAIGRLMELPSWAGWVSLSLLCAFCLLMLNKKLKAREVVR
jgi:ABC-2 type transport system permease protein